MTNKHKMDLSTPQALFVRAERSLRLIYVPLLVCILFQFFMSAAATTEAGEPAAKDRVLKVRGIIVVDENGRERILIGAPIPISKDRIRTDAARAVAAWGKNFPPQYVDWYKGYRHSVNGMLVLDEGGFDRVAVGDRLPDPNIGKRIGDQSGILFNDEKGFERGAFGFIKTDERSRVVLGLDSQKGEAATISVLEDGSTGLRVARRGQSSFLGFLEPGTPLNNGSEAFNGLMLNSGKDTKFKFDTFAK